MTQSEPPDARAPSPSQPSSSNMTDELQTAQLATWEPSRHQKAIIYTIGVLNLIVALDASIIVTSLAVSPLLRADYSSHDAESYVPMTGNRERHRWLNHSSLLDRHVVSPGQCYHYADYLFR